MLSFVQYCPNSAILKAKWPLGFITPNKIFAIATIAISVSAPENPENSTVLILLSHRWLTKDGALIITIEFYYFYNIF